MVIEYLFVGIIALVLVIVIIKNIINEIIEYMAKRVGQKVETGAVFFGNWPSEIHYDHEQVQRILAAQSRKLIEGIKYIDKANQTIIIKGTSAAPYIATADSCTCPDFGKRGLPCKHMYRLAIEMGWMNDLPQYNAGNNLYNPESEIFRYRNLYKKGLIPGETYVQVCKAIAKLKK